MEFDITDSNIVTEVKEEEKPKKTQTVSINMEEVKEQEEKEVNITFSKGNILDEISDAVTEAKENTGDSTEKSEVAKSEVVKSDNEETRGSKPTVEETRIQLDEAEGEDNDLEYEDYEFAAEMILEGLEWGLGSIFCFIAQEKDNEQFAPTAKRTKKLTGMLTKGLVKMNFKFNIIGAFVVMMLITYGTIGAKAVGIRKEKKKAEGEAKKLAAKNKIVKKPLEEGEVVEFVEFKDEDFKKEEETSPVIKKPVIIERTEKPPFEPPVNKAPAPVVKEAAPAKKAFVEQKKIPDSEFKPTPKKARRKPRTKTTV